MHVSLWQYQNGLTGKDGGTFPILYIFATCQVTFLHPKPAIIWYNCHNYRCPLTKKTLNVKSSQGSGSSDERLFRFLGICWYQFEYSTLLVLGSCRSLSKSKWLGSNSAEDPDLPGPAFEDSILFLHYENFSSRLLMPNSPPALVASTEKLPPWYNTLLWGREHPSPQPSKLYLF